MLTIKTKTRDGFSVDKEWTEITDNKYSILHCRMCGKDVPPFFNWNYENNMCNKCIFYNAETSAYRYSVWYLIKRQDKLDVEVVKYSSDYNL